MFNNATDNTSSIEDINDISTNPSKKRMKISKSRKLNLPTLDEQKQLHQVEQILNTNILHLQMSELVNEVKFQKKTTSIHLLEEFYNKFVDILNQSSYHHGDIISNKWLEKKKLGNLFSLFCYSQTDISIAWEKPEGINIIGSYPIKTSTNPYLNLDIAITMPTSCFTERDILNFLYFDKRNLYLAWIYHELSLASRQHTEFQNIEVTYFKGDSKKPIIVIKPNLKGWKDLNVRVFMTIPSSVFKITQLNPSKNNLRPKDWMEALKNDNKMNQDASTLLPTPLYNNSIAEDIAIGVHHKIITGIFQSVPVACELLILLKVWLTQRDLRYGINTFDSHSMTLLVSYLFQTKRINNLMKAHVAFQVVMKFLSDLSDNCILSFNSIDIKKNNSLDKYFKIQLLHPLGSKDKFIDYNTFWRISYSTWEILKHEAFRTLALLQNSSESTFTDLFLTKISIFDREDLIFHIPIDFVKGLHQVYEISCRDNIEVHDHIHSWEVISIEAYHLIKESLKDRITSLSISIKQSNIVLTSQNYVIREQPFVLTIGVTLDIEKSLRKVERGPSYDNQHELERFRKFWGDKCQLRRFQDGSIVEAIVWENVRVWIPNQMKSTISLDKSSISGCLIIGEIVRYIMSKNFNEICGKEGENIQSQTLVFESQLHMTSNVTKQHLSTSKELLQYSKLANETLDSLRMILTSSIKGMPIMIESLQAIDPELRYTSTLASCPHPIIKHMMSYEKKTNEKEKSKSIKELTSEIQGKKLSMMIKPLVLIGRLESSGKWPSDAKAIKHLKSSIIIKMYELLKDQFQVMSIVHHDSLDVFYLGYTFRLFIIAEKEEFQSSGSLLQTIPIPIPIPIESSTNENPISNIVNSEASNSHIIDLAFHHQCIRNVVSNYTHYGDTVRCVMVWLGHSYLSGLLTQELIEIIVAYVFIHTYPRAHAPTSCTIAFLQFLRLLASFEWKAMPFICDLDNSLTNIDRQKIQSSYELFQKDVQSTRMYIITSYQRKYNFQPLEVTLSNTELNLLVQSAQHSYDVLFHQLSYQEENDKTILSIASISNPFVLLHCGVFLNFDQDIIKLHDTMNGPSPSFSTIQTFKNTPIKNLSIKNLMIRYSHSSVYPIQEEILFKLRRDFHQYALFFWNHIKCDRIGILWKPATFLPHKVLLHDCSGRLILDKDRNQSIVNMTELLAQMIATCDGFISNFELF